MAWAKFLFMLASAFFLAACVTSTQLCVECQDYGSLSLNRTMDTGK